MHKAILIIASIGFMLTLSARAQNDIEAELKASSDEHMREELGINPVTSPSIATLLNDLEAFRPAPLKLLDATSRETSFNNRLQTALHFGSLVADGFILTIAERPKDVQDVGKELIRQARALGIGERLTKRSKSLLDLSDKGDWIGMRQELVRTQEDVENTMMELRDEEMAHIVSLGGWLRGFQIGTTSTAEKYTPAKADILAKADVIDYFIDRLETLNPDLKQTEMVSALVEGIKKIRLVLIETQGVTPTEAQVAKLKQLADEAHAIATARVDEEGRFTKSPNP